MVKNYMSLPPPADGLVSRWGSSASSHWRSSQLFWLSLHKHTDRYGIESCRICFFIMYQLAFFCSLQRDWRDVFWQQAGCAWTTSSFLFCSSWHQQSNSRAVLCVIFFFTSFAVLRTWIGKFWFFFSSGETHHLTNAVFSIHLSDYFCSFLPQGLHFVPVIRLLIPDWSWRAGGRRRCCLHSIAEECEAVSDPCAVLHLHGGECTHLGLAFPTSRKGMNDKGLFLDLSGCCQGKTLCWCCISAITVTMNQDI